MRGPGSTCLLLFFVVPSSSSALTLFVFCSHFHFFPLIFLLSFFFFFYYCFKSPEGKNWKIDHKNVATEENKLPFFPSPTKTQISRRLLYWHTGRYKSCRTWILSRKKPHREQLSETSPQLESTWQSIHHEEMKVRKHLHAAQITEHVQLLTVDD